MTAGNEASSVAGASAKGAATLSVARAIAIALQFVTFAVLAHHLGPRGFGVYTFGVAVARLFGSVTSFGLKQLVIRDAAQQPGAERWLVPNLAYLRVLLGVAGYGVLAAGVVVIGYSGEERDAALVAGTLIVLGAAGSFAATLELRLRVGWVAVADVVEAVALLGGVVVLRSWGASPLAMVAAYVVANLLNNVVVLVAALRTLGYDWRPQPARWLALLRAAVPLGLAGVFAVIYWQTDIAMLARLRDAGEVGQYGAAYRILDAATVAPMIAMVLLGPVLARSVVEGRDVLQRRFATAAHLVTLVSVPLTTVGALTAWRVLPVLPGFGDYGRGAVILSVLSLAAGLIFVTTLLQGMLISAHRQRRLLGIAATGAVVNAAVNLLMIPLFGAYGAAATTTATEAGVFVLSYLAVHRDVGVRWPLHRFRPVALAGVITAIVSLLGYALPPLVQLALALATYVVALLALGGLRWTDLGGLLRAVGPTVEIEPCGMRAARNACRDAARCVVIGPDGRVPWRTALGARLAGCGVVEGSVGVAKEREQTR